MTDHPLADALASLGIDARVEARDSLAVVTVPNAETAARFRDVAIRRSVVALASAHGFKTVALELERAEDDRAAVSGD